MLISSTAIQPRSTLLPPGRSVAPLVHRILPRCSPLSSLRSQPAHKRDFLIRRQWLRDGCDSITRSSRPRWTVMPTGGHFAPMEEPKLLADDLRAFFRTLR
jgi:hypothetical protein